MKKAISGCNCVVVNSEELKEDRNNIINITLDTNKSSIIKGTVFSVDGIPCYGATVEVNEINPYNNKKKLLGYVVTDRNGEYEFSVEAKYHMKYEVKVYSPLKAIRG